MTTSLVLDLVRAVQEATERRLDTIFAARKAWYYKDAMMQCWCSGSTAVRDAAWSHALRHLGAARCLALVQSVCADLCADAVLYKWICITVFATDALWCRNTDALLTESILEALKETPAEGILKILDACRSAHEAARWLFGLTCPWQSLCASANFCDRRRLDTRRVVCQLRAACDEVSVCEEQLPLLCLVAKRGQAAYLKEVLDAHPEVAEEVLKDINTPFVYPWTKSAEATPLPDDGYTPLHFLCAAVNAGVANAADVKVFVEYGANTSALDMRGRRPLALLTTRRRLKGAVAAAMRNARRRRWRTVRSRVVEEIRSNLAWCEEMRDVALSWVSLRDYDLRKKAWLRCLDAAKAHRVDVYSLGWVLFGLLTIPADYESRDELVSSMGAWGVEQIFGGPAELYDGFMGCLPWGTLVLAYLATKGCVHNVLEQRDRYPRLADDVRAKDAEGRTALHHAVAAYSTLSEEELLRTIVALRTLGVDANERADNGMRAEDEIPIGHRSQHAVARALAVSVEFA